MKKKTTAIALIIITFTALFTGTTAEAVETSINLSATASGMTLLLTPTGTGTGTYTFNDSMPYAFNDVLLISAIPDEGSRFTGWSGSVITTDETIILKMDETKNLIAEFTLDIVSFDLSTTELAFGEVFLGTSSEGIDIAMTNTGNVDLMWSHSITETNPFFAEFLRINGNVINPTHVNAIGVGQSYTNTYSLNLSEAPDAVAFESPFTGTLVYWAEAIPPS